MAWVTGFIAACALVAAEPGHGEAKAIRVPISKSHDVDVTEVITRLATATGVEIARPSGSLPMPIVGLAGKLARTMLADNLGPEVTIQVQDDCLRIGLAPEIFGPERRSSWVRRIGKLSSFVERELQRRAHYGMHALRSYRPNDPRRPTICLVHGMNSSSGGFVNMIRPLEEAGFGLVVFDYAFNRDLDESCEQFARDWAAFRLKVGERRPWAIVAHSMGALVARSYVEDPKVFANDVTTLVLIGPVNQGSSLAKAQKLRQLLDGMQAVNGKKGSDALASLSDGLGEAADDILPGSAFLKALNARPRQTSVAYHILAGDAGFVSPTARRQIEDQIALLRRSGGLLGGLARIAGGDLLTGLEELCDGSGDGCVSVPNTRLDGVADHVTIHANHAELIRAPLLFPDPGPVACMPYLRRWLAVEQNSGEKAVKPVPARP